MRLFRLLHLLTVAALSLVALVAFGLSVSLIATAGSKITRAQKHLAELLSPPIPLTADISLPRPETLTLRFQNIQASTSSASLLRTVTADEALFIPILHPTSVRDKQTNFLVFTSIKQQLTWDETKVRAFVASVSARVETHALPPAVTWAAGKNPTYVIFPGKSGTGLDIDRTVELLLSNSELTATITGPATQVFPPLNTLQLTVAKERLAKLFSAPLSFTAQNKTFTIAPSLLARLVTLPHGFSREEVSALISSWAKGFDIEVVEPELAFDGKKIQTFRAPIEGRRLDQEKNTELLLATLVSLEETGNHDTKELRVLTDSPKVTLDSLNDLGITERIGRGDSEYHHSIPNRIFNVALATSRIHSKIIMPGETFSFNRTLGEVSAGTGFKQAYVIDKGQTILGDGGGVCQVSSTFFRALLSAGLPIVSRRGHSYRVGYYEQNSRPGFDATVSAPSPDLTFINDTGAPILINAQADSKNVRMYIELYGKSDGRKAEILNYKQWDSSPAPPPSYQDDPTLPIGVIKQIDFAAPGLKTSFEYRVVYPDGRVKGTTYLTAYIPWQARFLRGTKP